MKFVEFEAKELNVEGRKYPSINKLIVTESGLVVMRDNIILSRVPKSRLYDMILKQVPEKHTERDY